jgi:hypothetical protein
MHIRTDSGRVTREYQGMINGEGQTVRDCFLRTNCSFFCSKTATFRMTNEPSPQNHPSAGNRDRCPFTKECGSRNHPLMRRQIFTRRAYHRDNRVYNDTSQNNPSPITTVTIGLQLWVTLLLPWIPVMPGKAKNSLKTPLTI